MLGIICFLGFTLVAIYSSHWDKWVNKFLKVISLATKFIEFEIFFKSNYSIFDELYYWDDKWEFLYLCCSEYKFGFSKCREEESTALTVGSNKY
jgi:hypothetical protein